tara:strand:- start:261 stop:2363 length:2103 start_codon:yes stop_codon:yes gene_type:complete
MLKSSSNNWQRELHMKTSNWFYPLIVTAASTVLLTACGAGDESSGEVTISSSDSGAAQDSTTSSSAMATVALGVRFPEPDAFAAWVGNSEAIKVRFYRTSLVSSWSEEQSLIAALDVCDGLDSTTGIVVDGFACDDIESSITTLKGTSAGELVLTRDESVGYIDLTPGNYRMEASFYDGADNVTETSVAYAVLGTGAHTVVLRGYGATWTADSTITPMLLGTASTALRADWDPDAEGDQTAAAALGIANGIVGVHLPSARAQPLGWSSLIDKLSWNTTQLAMTGVRWSDFSAADELQQSAFYVPVLRTPAASGSGETLVPFSAIDSYSAVANDDGSTTSETVYSWSLPSTVMQSYENGVNSLDMVLAESGVYAGTVVLSADLLSYQTTSVKAYYELGALDIDAYANDAYSVAYLNEDSGTWFDETRDDWVSQDLVLANIFLTDWDDSLWRNIYTSLAVTPVAATNGSTLTGYFVESLYTDAFYQRNATNTDEAIAPPLYISAALQKIAQAQGLIASGADGCETYEGDVYKTAVGSYRWDASNQRWEAGTYNTLLLQGGVLTELDEKIQSFQYVIDSLDESDPNYEAYLSAYQYLIELHDVTYRTTILSMADFNEDGVAELFEPGVYIVSGAKEPSCRLTETDVEGGVQHGLECDDFTLGSTLDTTIAQSNGTVCAQAFTLTAEQLADLSAMAETTESSDQ